MNINRVNIDIVPEAQIRGLGGYCWVADHCAL